MIIEDYEKGVTNVSKQFVEENLHKIGKVIKVVLRNPFSDIWKHYGVEIVGTKGSLYVYGFSWGYGGEGCRGLLWLFQKLGLNYTLKQISQLPQKTISTTFYLNST